MTNNGKPVIYAAMGAILLAALISGCGKSAANQAGKQDGALYGSYRDVPGVTQDEINAIEALKIKYSSFFCVTNLNTDAFIDKNGEPSGFSFLFYEWLSGFFGIPFKLEFRELNDLISGVTDEKYDFTIEMTDTPERRKTFFMTSPIAERQTKIYRISGSESIENIIRLRQPRYGFPMASLLPTEIAANAEYDFEAIKVDSPAEAYKLLESGEIDGYISLDTVEAAFDECGSVVTEDYFPLIFRSSCLLTRKEELKPIISVMEKALNDRTVAYLIELRNTGHLKYLRNKLYTLLTEEERSYIRNHPVVPIAAEINNYPVCFFDTNANQWQGIYFDALSEIGNLTDLKFERVNGPQAQYPALIDLLENGKALILSELFHIEKYKGQFIWSDVPVLKDNYAFITRLDYPDIEVSEIPYLRVGGRKDTPYLELFTKMFPNHKNYTVLDTQEEIWDALKHGKIDVLFASRRRLVVFTNYYEEAGFKLSVMYDHEFGTYFGFNKDAAVLKSIIDKALRLINIKKMSNQWMNKTYDYRYKLVTAQRPWLLGSSILLVFFLAFVTFFLVRSRSTGRMLRRLVRQRTNELERETTTLKAIFNSSPDFIFCKDLNLHYTRCNKSLEKAFNVSEEEIAGKSDRETFDFSEETAEKFIAQDKKVLDEKESIVFEDQIVTRQDSGQIILIETIKTPLIQNGEIIGIMGISRDITRRKAIEREIDYHTSLLKTIISSLPDVVFCKDLNFKYTLCNKYLAGLFNKNVEDILGKDDANALSLTDETAKLAYETDMRVVSEKQRITYEEWLACADGVSRLFETVKSPLILDGTVIGIVAIGRDITMRKAIESELSLQTSMLKTMINSLPDVVFCKDMNLKYTLCNRAMADYFDIGDTGAIVGLDDLDGIKLNSEEAKIANDIDRKVMTERRQIIYEEYLTGADNVGHFFETIKVPLIQNDNVVGMIGIGRDITQRKAMEEELRAASLAKSAFLANMSHELRTPLNVVIGLTDLVLEENNLAGHITENLAKISDAGNTLLSIVNDILDFSKIESGKIELTPVEYHMSSLLNDVITLVSTRLGEKPITFKLNISDNLPNSIYGDDLRVKQILNNFLSNAIKYTRSGTIELSVSCKRDGDDLLLEASVKDTGIGISEENLKKLFADYNQVDTRANRNIEGTGLGLAITKRLTELMGGEIKVESEYGKGSTFSFYIRQGFVSDTPIGNVVAENLRKFRYADDKRAVTKKLVRRDLSYARVLVVDDMQTNLDVAAGLLRKYKMQVDCLHSGPEAIERVRSGSPVYNAIFMDHMMPGMDGIEAAGAIRALDSEYTRKIPIIALTANAIQGTDTMFYEHGFQAFISKPIDIMELDSVIKKLVRNEPTESATYNNNEENHERPPINITGVDTELGLSLYGDDLDIYLPALYSYVSNTPDILNKLKTVSKETLPEYIINVHGLKGSSVSIGAELVRETAANLEKLARAGDLQGILERNERLIKGTENIVANIKAWLEKNDVGK
jgi:PAS domain S-box-containing protein